MRACDLVPKIAARAIATVEHVVSEQRKPHVGSMKEQEASPGRCSSLESGIDGSLGRRTPTNNRGAFLGSGDMSLEVKGRSPLKSGLLFFPFHCGVSCCGDMEFLVNIL